MPIVLDTTGVSRHCPAKLNLALAVGDPREDGLHPIASVMVALDFGDTLYINRLFDGPSRFVREYDPDKFDLEAEFEAPPIQPVDWPIEQDLIYKAHALMEKTVGRELPIECGLDKRVPAGAGLGGGSSDAAGMLVALRDLFGLGVTDERLVQLGQSLGADVGFLVHAQFGRTVALVTGIGEVIEPIGTLPVFDVVLVFPDGKCPTAEVYAAFDRDAALADAEDLVACAQRWRLGGELPAFRNDLFHAAERVCPPVSVARSKLAASGIDANLTGSGSALFVMADSEDQSSELAGHIRGLGLVAVATRAARSQKSSDML